MKSSLLLFFGLLMLALHVRADLPNGQDPDPAWSNAQRTNPIVIPDGNKLAQADAAPAIKGDNSASPVVAEAITSDIQALARGLENDPVRIFNYVHDHIKYVLYFGSKKGAELTLLEKSGNDFDQSALLVALLRAAGYSSAAYQFGWMGIPYDATDGTHNDLHHWLGLTQVNTNWVSTTSYLNNLFWNVRGYPTYYPYFGDNNTFMFQRVWVTLVIGTNNYWLDPAFKVTEPIPGINMSSAMSLNTNSLLSAAAGTDAGYYVSGLNEGSVRATLTGYTTNLLNYIQSNVPNSSVEQILGGRYIVPSTNTTLPTSLMFYAYPWTNGYNMPIVNWTNEPTSLMSSMAVTFAATNGQWYIPQLQGQRLSLTFSTSGLAQLWQDDALLAQNATSGGSTISVALGVNHPIGSWDFTNNVLIDDGSYDLTMTNSYQRTNATYALVYAFEPDWGWLQARENQMDNYRQQGLADTSRQVASETLNIMGLTWMLQSDRVGQTLGTQIGVLQQFHNRWGRMAQESGHGYYVDIYSQLAGLAQSGGTDNASFDREARDFDLFTYFGSALEHGIIEQLQTTNLVGASTVKMLEIASTNSQKVYLASSTNWTTGANVESLLVNYPSATLSRITSYINAGYYILLPQNGSNHLAGTGTWGGYGYVSHINEGNFEVTGFSISGGYQGGYVSDPTATPNTPYVATTVQAQPQFFSAAPPSAPLITGADPVDMADGTFQIQSQDLSIGQAEPRGITLSRYYNGRRRYSNPAGMSGGWLHNYFGTAVQASAPQAGLGATTPAQMAPILVATCASIGIYNDTAPDPKNWVTTALIAKWAIDQLTRNGVSVSLGQDTIQFVLQPDGRFTPPANCTWTLSKGSTYSLQQRHGNKFVFDSQGRLTNIVDQYSQPLSITYNSSNWVQTVTDWKGRYFTFNYSGSPQRLASVSDSTGRSVNYGYSTSYSSQGDLTSVTDPENKTSTYNYDANHQVTATFDPLSRLVVSNIYDGVGHVATQYTQGDTNKTWQIYWSGWQSVEKDPMSGRRVISYDDKTRPVSILDALGHLTQTVYDGQDHVVETISALNETNLLFYDGNHNLLETIDPLGYSNLFYYDGQFSLVKSVDAKTNQSNFGYNSNFQLTGATNGAGDWVTYVYDGTYGLLTTKTDSGGTTTYAYSGLGQLSSIRYPGNLGGEGFLNSSLGDVLSRTNGRGFVTSYQYNQRRELTNTIAPTNLTMSITMDAAGNVQSTTDARGLTASNSWSATRKLLARSLPATPQGVPVTTNVYDQRDWLSSTTNPLHQATVFTNDAAHRLTSVTDPLLRTTQYTYDADDRKTTITDAAYEITQQQWDGRGGLTQLTDPATHTVEYVFDGVGNRIYLTNRNSKTWRFQFDGANRLTNTISPLGHHISQSWNNRGLLSSVQQNSGQTANYLYDPRGRLTNRTDNVAATLYGYDANNNVTNVAENGRTNSWVYDAYDRVSAYQDADGNLIQYRYDANNNLTNLVYPGGRNVYYGYDSLNRLTNVTDWQNRQTTLTYDLANHLTTISRPNGTVRQINYDADGEVTNIVEKTTANMPVCFFTLGWTNSGRVAWEFAAPLPPTNALPSRGMYFDADNRMTNFNGQSVSYDLDGNMTNGPLNTSTLTAYAYDGRNRLLNAGGLSYGYDPAGNRTAITNGSTVTKLVINSNAKLPQVLMRVIGTTTNYYVYGAGLLYQVTETATSSTMSTYHFDLRGSTVALTDANGYVTDRVQYAPYGMVLSRSGATDTPFLYNGRYGVMTEANGLLYMRARYYNPYICRFINPDPSGFAGGLNWFCFADGNPINMLDPFGLCSSTAGAGFSWVGTVGTYTQGQTVGVPGPVGYFYGTGGLGNLGAAALNTLVNVENGAYQVLHPVGQAIQGVIDFTGWATQQLGGDPGTVDLVQRAAGAGLVLIPGGGEAEPELIGVTQGEASALARQIHGIQVEGESAITSAEAFGSRAGSTFRGVASSTSDLDILVQLNSKVVNGANGSSVINQLSEINSLFQQTKGFPLDMTIRYDFEYSATKAGLLQTPFVPLKP